MTVVERIGPLVDLPDGTARRVEVGEHALAVVRIGDDVYAIGDRCTHQDISLSEGEVSARTSEIECWKHGSAFSLETGEPEVAAGHEAGARVRGPCGRRPDRGGGPVTEHVLKVEGLRAGVAGKEILKGIDLMVRSGEVHAVMGPNGSGKSTLSHVIMGRPGYEVLGGSVTLDGVDLLGLAPWERAQAGLFLAMQYPTEVPGVAVVDVLEAAFAGLGRDASEVPARIIAEAERIGFDDRFLHRALNVDLSGGEKKRNETLQLGVLGPRSPSSTSSTRASTSTPCGPAPAGSRRPPRRPVSACWPSPTTAGCSTSCKPDDVHVLADGAIQRSGGPELADELETTGYAVTNMNVSCYPGNGSNAWSGRPALPVRAFPAILRKTGRLS